MLKDVDEEYPQAKGIETWQELATKIIKHASRVRNKTVKLILEEKSYIDNKTNDRNFINPNNLHSNTDIFFKYDFRSCFYNSNETTAVSVEKSSVKGKRKKERRTVSNERCRIS